MTLRKWPGCGQSGGILRRSCDNQYRHAAVAKEALEGKIPPGTIVRIESRYPLGACRLPAPHRIQGFVYRNDRDITQEMIREGYGVTAFDMWYHKVEEPRREELRNAQGDAKDQRIGIWNPNACEKRCDLHLCTLLLPDDRDRLLLHPHYYRRWRRLAITLEEAIDYSRIKLSHRSKE